MQHASGARCVLQELLRPPSPPFHRPNATTLLGAILALIHAPTLLPTDCDAPVPPAPPSCVPPLACATASRKPAQSFRILRSCPAVQVFRLSGPFVMRLSGAVYFGGFCASGLSHSARFSRLGFRGLSHFGGSGTSGLSHFAGLSRIGWCKNAVANTAKIQSRQLLPRACLQPVQPVALGNSCCPTRLQRGRAALWEGMPWVKDPAG